MNKKILIILICFLLTGCWNYQELNSLAISTAIAIDQNEDDEYEISLLIANSKKAQTNSENAESQTVVYSGKGKTISEALKSIDSLSSRQIYLGHISVVIISEDLAKKGILNTLDFLLRYSESTKRFQLAIAKKTKAKNILKIITPLETFPAQGVTDNIEVSHESQAKSSSMLYSKFIYLLLEKGINPILPSIIVSGDIKDGSKNDSLQKTTPDAYIKLSTIALFKNDKLIDYADDDESKGINIIRNQIDRMNVYLKCGKEYTTIQISELNSKLKIDDPENLKMSANVKAQATILEDNCKHDLSKQENIDKIEKQTEKEMKKLMGKGLDKTIEIKSDLFGFGNLLYKNHPKLFKKYKNWDDNGFVNSDIDLNVNIQLKFKGSAKQTLKEAFDEDKKH